MNSFGIQGFYPFLEPGSRSHRQSVRAAERRQEGDELLGEGVPRRAGRGPCEQDRRVHDTEYIAAEVSEHVPLLLESELVRRLLSRTSKSRS